MLWQSNRAIFSESARMVLLPFGAKRRIVSRISSIMLKPNIHALAAPMDEKISANGNSFPVPPLSTGLLARAGMDQYTGILLSAQVRSCLHCRSRQLWEDGMQRILSEIEAEHTQHGRNNYKSSIPVLICTYSIRHWSADVPNVDTLAVYTERRKATESRFMVHDVWFFCEKWWESGCALKT